MGTWEDITSQVENLARVLDSHESDRSGALDRAAQVLDQGARIVYCGVGTGLFSCIPACYYLLREGKAASYLDATEAVYDLLPGLRDAALVLNTRSGETAELVKLARLAREAGIQTVAVTNELASTVGRLVDVAVPTHSRWDDLEGALSIELPDLPPHALALLEIVPCHVLAYDLALAAGLTPGNVRYIKQVITSEEGLPSAG